MSTGKKPGLAYLLALLDALPVMLMILLTVIVKDRAAFPVIITALLMFVWHFAEHSILASRFVKAPPAGYVGFMEWPNIAFTGIILTAFAEMLLRRWYHALPVIDQQMAYMGCLLTTTGILVRVWAYLSLKEEFMKPPGRNERYIRSGPYRFSRHPANSGFFLIGMGVATGLFSLFACVAGMLLLLPSLVFVSHYESKLLNEK